MQAKIVSAVIASLLVYTITMPSTAQTSLNLPTDHAGIVALQARQQKDETEMRKVLV